MLSTIRESITAYKIRSAKLVPAPFPHRSSRISRLAYGLGFSLLAHLSLGLCPVAPPSVFKSPITIEEELKRIEDPKIEKNKQSDQDKIKYREKLREYIAHGRSILEQFRKDRSSTIDYGNYLIPVEYYMQRSDDNVYLMPDESLNELMQIVQEDILGFASIAKSDLDRIDKIKLVRSSIFAKSVPDPGAHLVPSLLVPEGGQSCQARAQYLLILLSYFSNYLLNENEQFVITSFEDHDSLGIYNRREATLWLLDTNEEKDYLAAGPQAAWTADLFHPAVFIQRAIDLYDRTDSSYDDFLVATANAEGNHTKVEIKGPRSPLSLAPPIRSGSTFSSGSYITLEREIANGPLAAQRRNRTLKRRGIIELDLISSEEYERAIRTNQQIKYLEDTLGIKDPAKDIFANRAGELRHTIEPDEQGNIIKLRLDFLSVSDLGFLELFPSLKQLVLDNTSIHDLSALKYLPALEELGLQHTSTDDISVLKHLPNLWKLSLNNTPVSDISVLQHLTKLKQLGLADTRVSDLSVLQHLTKLKQLVLDGTKISNFSVLQYLPDLEVLGLDSTPISDISVLEFMPHLKQLSLANTRISDISVLRHLPDLEMLVLYNTRVSDLGVLKYLPDLKKLYLGKIPAKDFSILQQLPHLEELGLSDTLISEDEIKRLESRGIKVSR